MIFFYSEPIQLIEMNLFFVSKQQKSIHFTRAKSIDFNDELLNGLADKLEDYLKKKSLANKSV